MTRDPLDDLGQGDRGLIELFDHLTSEATANELSGEYAALTMFRASRGPASPQVTTLPNAAITAGGARTARRRAQRRLAQRRRMSRVRVGGRLVAAATVVGLAGGFAAAGYAEVLPSSLQHLAHRIFSFAGLPDSPGSSGSATPSAPVTSHGPSSGGPSSPQPSSPGTGSPSVRPSSSPSSSRLPIPTIMISVVRRPHGQSELLAVSVPLAHPGDVVELEVLAGGQWRLAQEHRLHRGEQTEFSVAARKISVTYRVVLPATVAHGRSVSGQVTVAARHPQKGGQGGG